MLTRIDARGRCEGCARTIDEIVACGGASDTLKLPLETSDWLARDSKPTNPLLAHPKLLDALFSDDVLKGKHNSEAIEVAPGTLVVVRVAEGCGIKAWHAGQVEAGPKRLFGIAHVTSVLGVGCGCWTSPLTRSTPKAWACWPAPWATSPPRTGSRPSWCSDRCCWR